MVNKNLAIFIAASLMLGPSLYAIDYFRDFSTTPTTQTVPQPSDTQTTTAQNDAAITQAVKNAFNEDDDLAGSASTVNVNTTNGVVTLSGTVNSEQQKSDFEDAAEDVDGVSSVVNNLVVKTTM